MQALGRLSSPLSALKPRYQAVVVGSGYGGAIVAARLAEAGFEVCLLERGREFLPGDFPDTLFGLLGEVQLDTPARRLFSPSGLYDVRLNEQVNVLVGCGLGGTSLINANVAAWPDDRVFDDEWPAPFRGCPGEPLLGQGLQRAAAMLQPEAYPAGPLTPLKLTALGLSAAALNAAVARPPLTVAFRAGENAAGVYQSVCRRCGDCTSGCNYGAKRTTAMTYLPWAHRHRARIFTEVAVRSLQKRADGSWWVHAGLAGAGAFAEARAITLAADVVVLAAGTLGSTEILLRSRDDHDLALSSRLGHHFTANGDLFAFAYNVDPEVNAVGLGRRPGRPGKPVGPCITGMIDLRGGEPWDRGLVIEDGTPPGAAGGVLPWLLSAIAVFTGRGHDDGRPRRLPRELRRLGRRLDGGAGPHTGTFLVMTHDKGDGVIALKDGRARIEWPAFEASDVRPRLRRVLARAGQPLHGIHLESPYRPFTVHPLGGCRMADAAEEGVVDESGRVFSGRTGKEVHRGLYVCDGSVIPRSLGVNPLLLISALAERTAARLVSRPPRR